MQQKENEIEHANAYLQHVILQSFFVFFFFLKRKLYMIFLQLQFFRNFVLFVIIIIELKKKNAFV